MRPVLYLFCLISGACALVYEIAWVRLLKVDFGATVYAVSTVLTVFMGGLALGSWLFGRRVDRGRNPLVTYAAIELALGAYSALFMLARPQLHAFSVWLLAGSEASFAWGSFVKFLLSVLFLLPPATLIGGTFPVLAKLVADSPQKLGTRLGSLYAWNTLGAVAGCLGQAYYLIPTIGVSASVYMAAAFNGLLGVAAGLLAWMVDTSPPEVPAAETTSGVGWGGWGRSEAQPLARADWGFAPVVAQPQPPGRLLYAVAFFSGFAVLATEVLWTRLFSNFLTGNVLIFATLLGAFLTGISLGSFLVARFVDRLRRLDIAVGCVLVLNSFWLAGSVFAQEPLGVLFNRAHRLGAEFSGSGPVFLCLGALFVAGTVPAVCFGAVIPLLLRWGTGALDSLGRDVGRLVAFNTVGSIAGSFIAGFVLIAAVGVNAGLLLLAVAYGSFAMFVVRSPRWRVAAGVVPALWLGMLLTPSMRQPVIWFNGGFTEVTRVPEHSLDYVGEGVEATIAVWRSDEVLALAVNGLIVAEGSRRDLWDLLLKAHLPMMLHEDPREIAVVGLGAGVSLGAIEAYDVDRIDCIELAPEVLEAHKHFATFNNRCWEDPRARIWINDGRQFLLATRQRYDIINLDPVDPPVCNQYTQDFFQLCHDRLQEGGLTVLWIPLFRLSKRHVQVICKAFLNVFPESTLWYDGTSVLLIGRRGGPLEIDFERFLERVERPEVQDNLKIIGRPNALLLLSTYVTGPEGLARLTLEDVPANTDDRPWLEYALLPAGRLQQREFGDNLEMLIPYFDPLERWLDLSEADPETIRALQKTRNLMTELFFIRKNHFQGHQIEFDAEFRAVIEKYDLTDADLKLLVPFLQ